MFLIKINFCFLAEQSLTEAELLRARLIQPEKIFMDIEAAVWQIEYKAVAPVTETLLAAVANKLTAAFNLKSGAAADKSAGNFRCG